MRGRGDEIMIFGKIDSDSYFGSKKHVSFRLLSGAHVPIPKSGIAETVPEGIYLTVGYLNYLWQFKNKFGSGNAGKIGEKARMILELNKSQEKDLEAEIERVRKDKEDSLRLCPPTAIP